MEGEDFPFIQVLEDHERTKKWNWESFNQPGRSDHLILHHWATYETSHYENPVLMYDKSNLVMTYTDEQYEKYFKDAQWTKEETDELWNLCKIFDLRFVVIADRISSGKSIEDIKSRYYSISKKLAELKPEPEKQKQHNIYLRYEFDKQKELERKKQTEKLMSRTKEQIEEERDLMVEYRRIESALLKIQQQPQAPVAAPIPEQAVRKKYKKKGADDEAFIPEPEPVLENGKNEKVGPVSSNVMVKTAWGKMSKKMEEKLTELGVKKPAVASTACSEAILDLKKDLNTLLNLQKKAIQRENHEHITKLTTELKNAATATANGSALNASSQKKKFVITIPLRSDPSPSMKGSTSDSAMSPS